MALGVDVGGLLLFRGVWLFLWLGLILATAKSERTSIRNLLGAAALAWNWLTDEQRYAALRRSAPKQ